MIKKNKYRPIQQKPLESWAKKRANNTHGFNDHIDSLLGPDETKWNKTKQDKSDLNQLLFLSFFGANRMDKTKAICPKNYLQIKHTILPFASRRVWDRRWCVMCMANSKSSEHYNILSLNRKRYFYYERCSRWCCDQ